MFLFPTNNQGPVWPKWRPRGDWKTARPKFTRSNAAPWSSMATKLIHCSPKTTEPKYLLTVIQHLYMRTIYPSRCCACSLIRVQVKGLENNVPEQGILKHDLFLAFGNFTDELPAVSKRIKSAVLSKLASSSGVWRDRQVILTKNVLLIAVSCAGPWKRFRQRLVFATQRIQKALSSA